MVTIDRMTVRQIVDSAWTARCAPVHVQAESEGDDSKVVLPVRPERPHTTTGYIDTGCVDKSLGRARRVTYGFERCTECPLTRCVLDFETRGTWGAPDARRAYDLAVWLADHPEATMERAADALGMERANRERVRRLHARIPLPVPLAAVLAAAASDLRMPL